MLNKKQQSLVEQNCELINIIIAEHSLPHDEFYDVCAIALCEAAQSYNDIGFKFATFASVCIENAIRDQLKADCRHKRNRKKEVSIGQVKAIGSDVYNPDLWAKLGVFDIEKKKK